MIVIDLVPILITLLFVAVIIVGLLLLRKRDLPTDTSADALAQRRWLYGALVVVAVTITLVCSVVPLFGGSSTASKLIGGRGDGHSYVSSRHAFVIVDWPSHAPRIFPNGEFDQAHAYAEQLKDQTGRSHVPIYDVTVSTIKSWRGFWGPTMHTRSVFVNFSWDVSPSDMKGAWPDAAIELVKTIGDEIARSDPQWWQNYGHVFDQVQGDNPYTARGRATKPYLPGYIYNFISLLAFVAVPFYFARWRAYRRAAKLAPEP